MADRLGGGGTSAPLDVYGEDAADGKVQAKVFTKRNKWVAGTTPGTFTRNPADAVEDAIWSARRDTSTGYGIGVFDSLPSGWKNDHHVPLLSRRGRRQNPNR
jgi:hypothetical protein